MTARRAGVNLVRCLAAVVLADAAELVEDIVGHVAIDGRARYRERAAFPIEDAAAFMAGLFEVDQAAVNGQIAVVVVVDAAPGVGGIPGEVVTGHGHVGIVVDGAAVFAGIPRERPCGQLHVALVIDGAASIDKARGVLLERAAGYSRVAVVGDGAAEIAGVVSDEVGAGDRQGAVALDGAAVPTVVAGEDAALDGEVRARASVDGAAARVVGTGAVLEVHVDDGEVGRGVDYGADGQQREARGPAVAHNCGVEADYCQVYRDVGQGLVQAVNAARGQDEGLAAGGAGNRRNECTGVAGHVHGDRRLCHGRPRGSQAEDQGPAHGSGPGRSPYSFAVHCVAPNRSDLI